MTLRQIDDKVNGEMEKVTYIIRGSAHGYRVRVLRILIPLHGYQTVGATHTKLTKNNIFQTFANVWKNVFC